MVVSIVHRGYKYILMGLPCYDTATQHTIVEKIIEFAKSKVKIDFVVADRFFSNSEYINIFEKLHVKYSLIAKNNDEVRYIKSLSAPRSMPSVAIDDAKTNIITICDKKENKNLAYMTNIKINPDNQNEVAMLSARLDEVYHSRGNIENAFEMIKSILAKTTSNRHFIKYYYFLFACCLYNLWIIAEHIISVVIHGFLKIKTSIRFRSFLKDVLDQVILFT